MKVVTIILIMMVLVLILTSISTIIYMSYFKHVLNKRVAEGKDVVGKRTLIEPVRFFLIALSVLTIIGFAFLLFGSVNISGRDRISFEESNESVLALIDPDEEIPGYRRFSGSEGDVDLVWYVKTSSSDSFPDIMIHIDAQEEYQYSFKPDQADQAVSGKSDLKSGWYSSDLPKGKADLTITISSGASSFEIER